MATTTLFDPLDPPTRLGRKLWVGASAALLSAWCVLHMAGNLLVFGGPELINRYAAVLQQSPLLWPMRLGLGVLLLGHATLAMQLALHNGRARSRYRGPRRSQTSTIAGRRMGTTGPLIAGLVAYHVLHVYGVGHPDFRPGDVHHNLVLGLASPPVALAYLALAALFGLHLHHGLASACRTLGWERGARSRGPGALAATLTLGFCAPVLAVQCGLL